MTLKKIVATGASAAAVMLGTASCSSDNTTCNTAETVINNIMTRTSVRHFTDKTIAADTLETILKAGMAAPSAVNAQPWDLIVVTDRDMLDRLNAVKPHLNLETATAAIIVCGNMNRAMQGFGREYWIQDCSAVTENILLATHALGLGAVWCGVYPNPDVYPAVTTILGLPEEAIPLNIISMGYPAEEQHPKDKWDPSKVHYQHW